MFITVPSEASSVSEAFFRFSGLSLTQTFGDQVIFSNCIESLEVIVRKLFIFAIIVYLHIDILLTSIDT